MLHKKMSDVIEKRSAILCRRVGIEQQNPFFIDKNLECRESATRFPMLQVFEEHFLNRDVFFDDESNARNRLVDMQSFTVMSLEFKIWQSAVKESISVFAKRCSDTRNNILTNPSFLNGKDIHSQCLGLINVGIQRVGHSRIQSEGGLFHDWNEV